MAMGLNSSLSFHGSKCIILPKMSVKLLKIYIHKQEQNLVSCLKFEMYKTKVKQIHSLISENGSTVLQLQGSTFRIVHTISPKYY